MLEYARTRLTEFNDRVTYINSDLLQSNWFALFEHPFDAVVSSIAIHNVRSPERIRGIYHEIAGLLTAGGCFLNCDLVFDNIDTHLQWLEAELKDVVVFEQEGRMATFGGFK
jgi:ubiquinone/menaquinone biosynthesis C-methylase UbiE